MARLGYPVRIIGRLGDDIFGTQLRTHLEKSGIDISGVVTGEGTSGTAIIVVAQKGENSIVITAGANALLTPQDLETNLDILRSAGVVLTQLEIARFYSTVPRGSDRYDCRRRRLQWRVRNRADAADERVGRRTVCGGCSSDLGHTGRGATVDAAKGRSGAADRA